MADDLTTLLSDLRERLKSLDAAKDSGALTVEDADTGRITYRTFAEMRQARSDLVARIGELSAQINPAAPRRTRQVVMTGRSGW